MEKKIAWLLLGLISLFQATMLYIGYNGAVTAIVIPTATYLMGIVTKTAVDKLVKK